MKKPSEVDLVAMAIVYSRSPYIDPSAWSRRFHGQDAEDMRHIKAKARADARLFLRALRGGR